MIISKKFFIFLIMLISLSINSQTNIINHKIKVKIVPSTSSISVEDNISFRNDVSKEYFFELNSLLVPYSHSQNISLEKVEENLPANDLGMDRDVEGGNKKLSISKWKVTFKYNSDNFTIKYKGKIESKLKQSMANYQRGFSESPGIISEKGIYLGGSTYWIPTFENSLYVYDLVSELPENWKSVSQGKRESQITKNKKTTENWVCDKPQEEIFLIGAKFTEYSHLMNNGVEAMAFLRTPDEGLANKYLEVTEQYMQMYEELIDKYPYSKFALVENFWETGYGMPSFTLLGEKIIRFPFILHSSYPHELLHNWWGNSVYVDFKKGNWCEGLTAYLADHLIKEQRGQGSEYRRSTLQKFTDFVNKENDFPLNKFISRYDAHSEAIGYGKSLMFFHMLRQKLGDDIFIKGLKKFNSDFKFKIASFDDIRISMESVSQLDLKSFFDQWINRKGAPKLSIIGTDIKPDKEELTILLEQVQNDKSFNLEIPIFIVTNKGVQNELFKMSKKKEGRTFKVKGSVEAVYVDPFYDVFRTLDPKEVPPALSKIFASKENTFILPKNTKNESLYKKFISDWKKHDNDNFETVYDSEIDVLPENRTAWILGFENKFTKEVKNQLSVYSAYVRNDTLSIGNKKTFIPGKEFAITTYAPDDFNRQVMFVEVGNEKAIQGFVRKLPHYGKYSFLGFEEDEPTNILKGQWDAFNSPLTKLLNKNTKIKLKDEYHKALAQLKPLFSKERMKAHVEFMASKEMKGRGLGTVELDSVANYIANKFKEYGLKPLNEDYFQVFQHKFRDKGKIKIKNVIGIIPGIDDSLKESPVVISAHYDHLGLGWPDVHKGDEGKIHPGADDNASGVSILLELAKSLGKTLKPKRTIVFASFSGEEAGLIGSRYFVSNLNSDFLEKPIADINLDTDGRLNDKKLIVLNGNTAREWKFIFMGTDFTTGVKSEVINKELDSSDQFAFIEKGIPAVQLFTGAHTDYHRPTDTPDKIDYDGMVKVATVAKEVLEYLSERVEPMNFTGPSGKKDNIKPKSNKKTRKAATGSVPDFSYSGKGVKINSVIEGSAGDKAGLKAGDIIISLNGVETNDLRKYSNELKKYKPGDEVQLILLRNNQRVKLKLVLGER